MSLPPFVAKAWNSSKKPAQVFPEHHDSVFCHLSNDFWFGRIYRPNFSEKEGKLSINRISGGILIYFLPCIISTCAPTVEDVRLGV